MVGRIALQCPVAPQIYCRAYRYYQRVGWAARQPWNRRIDSPPEVRKRLLDVRA